MCPDRADSPLRVVHVGPHVYSFGGTQSVIRMIRDHRIGADEIVVVPTWDGRRHLHNAGLVLRAATAIARLPKGTVLHAHVSAGGGWLREAPLMALARLRGLRVVAHLHGFDFPEFGARHPTFVRRVLRHAHHVICLSEDAKEVVRRLLPRAAVTVLANPVTIDPESPSAADAPPIALFAGSVGYRKGVDVLVEAWRKLVGEGIDGECHVVGPIVDFTPPAIDGLVVREAVHPDEVPALLRTVRLIVLPSRAEGMPMILTEALAAARPFVATPVGGTPSITPDDEMLVPVGDVHALARAMSRYLTDPRRAAEAGRQGQEHVARTRSPEVIGGQLRAIYDSIET